jgi:hypothetical protein
LQIGAANDPLLFRKLPGKVGKLFESVSSYLNITKMKRIIYLAFLMPLFLVSCEKTPEARFSTNTTEPVVGQDVFFKNSSHNAKNYEWDFGDGFISNEENPVHFYQGTGTFEVTLTVTGKSGITDVAKLTLYVVIPTLLEIEVREYYDDYAVPDASVILYPSITDWDAQTNSVAEGFTDGAGIVVFAELDPYAYYVDVWEQNHDNYTLAEEDYQTYIRTPDVLRNRINRFIAWVDYVEHKGTEKGAKRAKIIGFERKHEIKRQPEVSSDTEGWQELYEKSIKVKK